MKKKKSNVYKQIRCKMYKLILGRYYRIINLSVLFHTLVLNTLWLVKLIENFLVLIIDFRILIDK